MIRFLFCTVLLLLTGCWTSTKVETTKEETLKKMKDTDILLTEYLAKVAIVSPSGGFVHHEGLTEVDSWGNFLLIEYSQSNFNQILVLRSAGPDGVFHTRDDLVRHSSTPNAWNVMAGLSFWTWFFIIWGISILLATFLYYSMHRDSPRKHPKLGLVFVLLLGPIALAIYLLKAFSIALGTVMGSGFELDFDLGDIDIF